jgi:3-isopropylmalate dehydrogenase
MNYDIAVIPGDGIGPEVITEALKVAKTAASIFGFGLKETMLPWGAEHYLKNGVVVPPGAFDELGWASAILFGAVGDPRIPPGPFERELLLAMRFHFDPYVNVRQVTSFPGVPVPVPIPPEKKVSMIVIRENTEDFYMGLGGRLGDGRFQGALSAKRKLYGFAGNLDLKLDAGVEAAFSLGLLSGPGIERIAKVAFDTAAARGDKRIHVATKANALPDYYGFWDERVQKVAEKYPEIEAVKMNVDNLCYQLPRAPWNFNVILCPNLFGDIVSDLTAALVGGLGIAPSANIGEELSMFEPVHGSAPDIVGTGKANPLAAILSAGLMLSHLGQPEAGATIWNAVAATIGDGDLPVELGGRALCPEVGDRVVKALKAGAKSL